MKICWLRHGQRQDRTQESGITKDSYSRLEELGGDLSEDYDLIYVFYSPRKRAAESAEAIVKGIKRKNKNVKLVAEESAQADEYDADEKYMKHKNGERRTGGQLYELMLEGVELSSKETIKQYVERLKKFNQKLAEQYQGNVLVIVVHHDFGLDFILKELLLDKNIKYQSDGDTRFKREEFIELIYDKGVLSQINLPTRQKTFKFDR